LNSYLVNRQALENELNRPLEVQVKALEKPTAEEAYLTALPKAERAKAEQILSDVKSFTPYRFDEEGRLVRDGSAIEGSSVKELVTRELKQKKKKGQKEPVGWEFFESYRKPKEKLQEPIGKRLRKKK
jgi:hypothetical protein